MIHSFLPLLRALGGEKTPDTRPANTYSVSRAHTEREERGNRASLRDGNRVGHGAWTATTPDWPLARFTLWLPTRCHPSVAKYTISSIDFGCLFRCGNASSLQSLSTGWFPRFSFKLKSNLTFSFERLWNARAVENSRLSLHRTTLLGRPMPPECWRGLRTPRPPLGFILKWNPIHSLMQHRTIPPNGYFMWRKILVEEEGRSD